MSNRRLLSAAASVLVLVMAFAGNSTHGAALAGTPAATASGSGPTIAGCAVFPPDNPWNRDVSDDPVEAGDDHHILVIDKDNCVLYELYHAEKVTDGWEAGSGAIFDLKSNKLRTEGWTSADAAGLPIFPGLVRYDEVQAGEIRHA